jgi:tetratricopeptide (TPR) repeat protein
MTEAAVRELPAHEREDRLFHLLDQQPFLLVLDGLERILLAYARMDAAHLADDDLDEQTANEIARFYGLPDEVKETYLEKHRLRQCADPRAGRFLRRLASVRASRVLVSTRLYPAELQTMTAQPLPGCYPLFLNGLTDDDALALWREFIGGERSGTSEQLLPLFNAFGNYPLLVRALAGRVASYRPAPGNYDGWRKDHPGFNPAAELDLRNAKTHVLHYALEGLGETQRQVLHTIAAFRMPATWDTLRAVLVGKGKKKPCRDDRALDDVLTELEDRGLVGWDRRANRYDLHPLVRGVVWQMLDVRARQNICGELHNYFQASPKLDDWEKVKSLEDLTPAVEMFHALVELERYDDAAHVFVNHLVEALIYRLGTSRQQIELLERLFPDGVEKLPRLASAQSQGGAIHVLAVAFFHNGEPRRAAQFYQRSVKIFDQLKNFQNLIVGLYSRSMALRVSGSLREAEIASSRALGIAQKIEVRFREEMCLQHVGIALATRGEALSSEAALRRSLGIFIAKRRQQSQGILNACLAQRLLWLNQPDEALPLAQEAWTLAHVQRTERDFINAARLHGEAALSMGDLPTAAERLYHAFIRARAVNFVEEELSALTALAELHRQQRKYDTACELLDQVWIPATRGPYPLLHADALNVLTTLERDAGNTDKAIAAATEAYKKAWCDGPPFAYHWGLEAARKHLRELGAPEPPMPPFDPSKFEPMPDVEINPKDEFYVEVDEEDGAAG